MKTEDRDFDAGEFFDEGVAEAGIEIEPEEIVPEKEAKAEGAAVIEDQQEEPEKKAADADAEAEKKPETNAATAALESIEASEAEEGKEKADEAQEADSVISKLLPEADDSGKPPETRGDERVPLEAHTKLRRRAQDAERKVEELTKQAQASTTSTGAEKPGTEEKSPFKKFVEENPDEDFIPSKVQLEQSEWQDAQVAARRQADVDTLQAAENQRQEVATINATANKAVASEQDFRKQTADYDDVVGVMLPELHLTSEEKVALLATENPAKELYDRCTARRNALRAALGVTTPASGSHKETPADTEDEGELAPEQTDEEIFDAAYGTE